MRLLEEFQNSGYALLKGIYSKEEIGQLRSLARDAFDTPSDQPGDGNENYIRSHLGAEFRGSNRMRIFSRNTEFRPFLFHTKLVDGLTELFGPNFVVFSEGGLHKSVYGKWHRDTNYQEENGHFCHYNPRYQVGTVAVYLQANDAYGGGMDVRLGTHKDVIGSRLLKKVQRRIPFREKKSEPLECSVPNSLGDVVVIDMRLSHRASPPKVVPIPAGMEKYGMFISVSRNNDFARMYSDITRSRSDQKGLEEYSMNPDLVAEAKKCGMTLL
jgi:hypothetical protein